MLDMLDMLVMEPNELDGPPKEPDGMPCPDSAISGIAVDWATTCTGRSTTALRPPVSGRLSWTLMPWRMARRPTTNRPIRRETDRSTAGGSARRRLASASSSSLMPMPESVTARMTAPISLPLLVTVILVSCGEKKIAFSTSSAIRWTMSLTAWPMIEMPDSTRRLTRS